ncbi:MAG: DNA-3-methyladenine glycosylase 2 family protein, partial [Acidimicrobiales bacterium]
YVAMRALRDPDAYMATDLGIKRGLQMLDAPTDAAALSAITDLWRPWRSYAMAHLWSIPTTAVLEKARSTT